MNLSHLKTHGFSCSTLGSFDVGGNSSNTGVNRFMIGENFCFQPHTLLYLYEYLIHGCMGETLFDSFEVSLFFLLIIWFIFWCRFLIHSLDERKNGWLYWCTLYIFGVSLWDMGSSPMSLEHIWLVTWSLYALENGGLLTCMYKHFHDFLMRHLLDVHF